MPSCPKCKKKYAASVSVCPDDGAFLTLDVSDIRESSFDPGQQIGEYVVEGVLGSGTFGDVYRGIHPLIGKQVAIKVLSRRFSSDPTTVSRFVSEARAVNQIRHRNLIDIFSFGQLEDGRHYHVMELLDGDTLEAFLKEKGRALTLVEAFPILKGLAGALDAAHAAGIAHRDLKPENVFLAKTDTGELYPKLLDFGVAKLLSEDLPRQHKTATGAAVGTPSYMSPEQCRGPDVDHRTDIYAFGVVMYRMLTGRLPFIAESVVQVMMKQMNDPPSPPSMHAPELHGEVDRIVLWLLEKDPEKRPQNLKMVIEQLESLVTGIREAALGEPGLTLPAEAQALEAPKDGAATRRSLVLGGGGIALVAAVGGGGYFLFRRRRRRRRGRSATPALPPPDSSAQAKDAGEMSPDQEVPPEPEVESSTISITVEGAPPQTQIIDGAGTVVGAPPRFSLPRSTDEVSLTFRAEGFVDKTIQVEPSDDRTIYIDLQKKRRTRPKHGKRPGGGVKPDVDAVEEPDF